MPDQVRAHDARHAASAIARRLRSSHRHRAGASRRPSAGRKHQDLSAETILHLAHALCAASRLSTHTLPQWSGIAVRLTRRKPARRALQVNLGAYFYELQKPRAALGCFEAAVAADDDDDGRYAAVARDNARVLRPSAFACFCRWASTHALLLPVLAVGGHDSASRCRG